MDYGRLNPFRWHLEKRDISDGSEYKYYSIFYAVFGSATAKLISIDGGSDVNLIPNSVTWTIGGQSQSITILRDASLVPGKYYIEMTHNGVKKYSDIITISGSDCFEFIKVDNSCDTFAIPWTQLPTAFNLNLPNPQHDAPTTEASYETIITEYGEEKKLRKQITKHHIWFVQPKWYRNLLSLLSVSDSCTYGGLAIKNIEFDEEAINEEMSQFTIHFEYRDLQEGNDCCVLVNLDDILNPDFGGGAGCTLAVSVSESSGTLTATVTGDNGSPLIKWYRNGVYITQGATLSVSQSGDYQAVVTEQGCRATDNYYIEDECSLMSVRVYTTGNFVNADLNNVPSGCSPAIEVIHNGSVVDTSVPYEASQSGTYFVKVTACDCEKSGGTYVNYSADNCNFNLSISENGNMLESTTDAVSPTYLWELETSNGIDTLGATADIPISGRGIYWLTITDGGCSQKIYYYLEPRANRGIYVRQGGAGTVWSIAGINLSNYQNPSIELRVTINGVVFSYVPSSPVMPNTYGINANGELLTPTSLTNPTIIIELI